MVRMKPKLKLTMMIRTKLEVIIVRIVSVSPSYAITCTTSG